MLNSEYPNQASWMTNLKCYGKKAMPMNLTRNRRLPYALMNFIKKSRIRLLHTVLYA
jgi:hypothetical protein